MKLSLKFLLATLLVAAIATPVRAAESEVDPDKNVRGPRDLALTCRSDFDNTSLPYRLYLPSAYDGKQSVPLLVALHGTSGNANTYFDQSTYGNGIYQREAEQRGIAILCPSEGDPIGRPTEWRGVGELHVMTALEDVCRRFQIDRDRIVLTGQSMGGTGTTYLCCRYPDLFDLLNLLRPSNRVLVGFKIDGAGLLEILEDNIRQEKSFDGQFLVQVSGCRYAFDRSRPAGERIVDSDIDPQRTYIVACTEGLLSRGDMLHLAGRLGKIEYEELELTNITAAWRYIDKHNGIINTQLDGRVRDVTKEP